MGRDRNWLVVQEFAPADVRGNGSAIGSERLILEPVGGFIWGGELLTDVRVDEADGLRRKGRPFAIGGIARRPRYTGLPSLIQSARQGAVPMIQLGGVFRSWFPVKIANTALVSDRSGSK